jgi:DNA repair exonuclease SbcCD ATPase subunit
MPKAIAACLGVFALFAGAGAHADNPERDKARDIIIGEGDFLEKLIALDQADIDSLRADLADARRAVEETIAEVRDLRAELRDAPGARFVVRVAFTAAREASQTAVDEALTRARAELDEAERRLPKMEISAAERRETQGAIKALRADLVDLEAALRELIAALDS